MIQKLIEGLREFIYAEIILNEARDKVVSVTCYRTAQDELPLKYESELMRLLKS